MNSLLMRFTFVLAISGTCMASALANGLRELPECNHAAKAEKLRELDQILVDIKQRQQRAMTLAQTAQGRCGSSNTSRAMNQQQFSTADSQGFRPFAEKVTELYRKRTPLEQPLEKLGYEECLNKVKNIILEIRQPRQQVESARSQLASACGANAPPLNFGE